MKCIYVHHQWGKHRINDTVLLHKNNAMQIRIWVTFIRWYRCSPKDLFADRVYFRCNLMFVGTDHGHHHLTTKTSRRTEATIWVGCFPIRLLATILIICAFPSLSIAVYARSYNRGGPSSKTR